MTSAWQYDEAAVASYCHGGVYVTKGGPCPLSHGRLFLTSLGKRVAQCSGGSLGLGLGAL